MTILIHVTFLNRPLVTVYPFAIRISMSKNTVSDISPHTLAKKKQKVSQKIQNFLRTKQVHQKSAFLALVFRSLTLDHSQSNKTNALGTEIALQL